MNIQVNPDVQVCLLCAPTVTVQLLRCRTDELISHWCFVIVRAQRAVRARFAGKRCNPTSKTAGTARQKVASSRLPFAVAKTDFDYEGVSTVLCLGLSLYDPTGVLAMYRLGTMSKTRS